MGNVLMGVQIVLCVLLILSVMLQDSKGAVKTDFGSEGNQAYFKPKGKEAFLSKLIRIIGVLFFINAIAMLLV